MLLLPGLLPNRIAQLAVTRVKRLLGLFAVVLASALAGVTILVLAAQQGPDFATTLGTLRQWSSSGNATGPNNNACASEGTAGDSIDLTGFGFSIPAAAMIDGIIVEPKFGGGGATTNATPQLLKAGSPAGTAKPPFTRPGGATGCSTSAFLTLGSITDLWGTTWTPTDINAANFGVRFAKGSSGTAFLDAVRITVAYSDVMTVTILAGTSLNASVAKADIEAGNITFLGQTSLKVVSTKNWRVRATCSVASFPAGADNPTPNAVEIKNNLGVFTACGTPGGVIVQTGTPTAAAGVTFNVDLRVVLSLFGDGKIGSYQFTNSYIIEENI